MDYRYLIKNHNALVQYLACNVLTKGYVFYSTAWIPEWKDPLLVDAKMITLYDAHISKQRAYRLRKGGVATVKYLRCGRLILLLATHGKHLFFERETGHKDARDCPISVGGYAISVNKQTGKVSVRVHREAQRRLKRYVMEWGHKRSREWWESWVRRFPFLPFAGVRDNLFAVIRLLNANRKSFKQAPVEWKECVRKKFSPKEVFLPSPPELLDLLRWHNKEKS